MSKAFTKEDDADGEEAIFDERLLLPEGSKNYMTPQGAEVLKKNYESLHSEKPSPKIDRKIRFYRAESLSNCGDR